MRPLALKVRNYALGTLFPKLFKVTEHRSDLVRIGTDYGGWWVPSDLLSEDSICYCAGVGKDISFDLGLIDRYRCQVWGIDPTPETIAWIAGQQLDPRFHFVALGLSDTVGVLKFYVPKNPAHISHSVTNLQHTDEYIEADCVTVHSLMETLGHDRVDLLKLDIEGAHHMVIDSLLAGDIHPRVLCVEFDQPEPISATRAAISKLAERGYKLVKVDWFNLTFVRPTG